MLSITTNPETITATTTASETTTTTTASENETNESDGIKFLHEGGWGCTFRPGPTCETTVSVRKEDNLISKVQVKTYQSMNEYVIGKRINLIPMNKLYFAAVQTQCPMDLTQYGFAPPTNFTTSSFFDTEENTESFFSRVSAYFSSMFQSSPSSSNVVNGGTNNNDNSTMEMHKCNLFERKKENEFVLQTMRFVGTSDLNAYLNEIVNRTRVHDSYVANEYAMSVANLSSSKNTSILEPELEPEMGSGSMMMTATEPAEMGSGSMMMTATTEPAEMGSGSMMTTATTTKTAEPQNNNNNNMTGGGESDTTKSQSILSVISTLFSSSKKPESVTSTTLSTSTPSTEEESLQATLKIPLEEIIRTYNHLERGLLKLADAEICHYDFKDNNVIFDDEQELPIIIDFGLSVNMNPVLTALRKESPSYDAEKFMDDEDEEEDEYTSDVNVDTTDTDNNALMDILRRAFYVYSHDYAAWGLQVTLIAFMVRKIENPLTERVNAATLLGVKELFFKENSLKDIPFDDARMDLYHDMWNRYIESWHSDTNLNSNTTTAVVVDNVDVVNSSSNLDSNLDSNHNVEGEEGEGQSESNIESSLNSNNIGVSDSQIENSPASESVISNNNSLALETNTKSNTITAGAAAEDEEPKDVTESLLVTESDGEEEPLSGEVLTDTTGKEEEPSSGEVVTDTTGIEEQPSYSEFVTDTTGKEEADPSSGTEDPEAPIHDSLVDVQTITESMQQNQNVTASTTASMTATTALITAATTAATTTAATTSTSPKNPKVFFYIDVIRDLVIRYWKNIDQYSLAMAYARIISRNNLHPYKRKSASLTKLLKKITNILLFAPTLPSTSIVSEIQTKNTSLQEMSF